MTIDCSNAVADKIEMTLEAAYKDGVAFYGTHRQDKAMMTCFVPSIETDDHVHFVDGADGGYTLAAEQLKHQQASALRA